MRKIGISTLVLGNIGQDMDNIRQLKVTKRRLNRQHLLFHSKSCIEQFSSSWFLIDFSLEIVGPFIFGFKDMQEGL
jgi:hypothetical protein